MFSFFFIIELVFNIDKYTCLGNMYWFRKKIMFKSSDIVIMHKENDRNTTNSKLIKPQYILLYYK